MKKGIILLMLGAFLPLSAQSISSVSYNPSRTGRYSELKASDRIVFLGGLKTPQLQVLNRVSLTWPTGDDGYKGTYYLNQLTGTGTLEFEQAVVTGINQTVADGFYDYDASSASVPALDSSFPFTLELLGGTEGTFLADSFAYTIGESSNPNLRVYSGAVQAQRLDVGGSSKASDGFLIEGNHEPSDNTTDGFWLSGGDIPARGARAATLQWCRRAACVGDNCATSQTVYLLGYQCENHL